MVITPAATATKFAGAATAGGGLAVAGIYSPAPLFVLAGVGLLVIGPVAVVMLTAALSRNPERQRNAATVLDKILAVVCLRRFRLVAPVGGTTEEASCSCIDSCGFAQLP